MANLAEGGEMTACVCTAVHRSLQLFKRRVPAQCVRMTREWESGKPVHTKLLT